MDALEVSPSGNEMVVVMGSRLEEDGEVVLMYERGDCMLRAVAEILARALCGFYEAGERELVVEGDEALVVRRAAEVGGAAAEVGRAQGAGAPAAAQRIGGRQQSL